MNKLENKNTLNREFSLTIKWNSEKILSNLTIGATYSEEDINKLKKFEYTVPEHFTLSNITQAIKHNVYTDIARFKLDRFVTINKHRVLDFKQYVLTDLKEIWNSGKKLVIASFATATSVLAVGGLLAFTQIQEKEKEVQITRNFTDTIKADGSFVSSDTIFNTKAALRSKLKPIVKPIIKKHSNIALAKVNTSDFLVGEKSDVEHKLVKPKTKATLYKHTKHKTGDVVELLPRVPLKCVELAKKINVEVAFNPPNIVKLYDGSYREELLDPVENKIKKFNSYEDGILYFYKLGVMHNLKTDKPINVVAMLGQLALESGFRPSGNGYCGKLGSFGNNFWGIKTLSKSTPGFHLKDDDYDKHGKLIESKFIIFSKPEEALEHYANFIYKPRYTDGKYDFTDNLEVNEYNEYLTDLETCGYCTDKNYNEKISRIIVKEILPVLKKHDLI